MTSSMSPGRWAISTVLVVFMSAPPVVTARFFGGLYVCPAAVDYGANAGQPQQQVADVCFATGVANAPIDVRRAHNRVHLAAGAAQIGVMLEQRFHHRLETVIVDHAIADGHHTRN